jgi:CheY-like chemotaxis protein
MRKQQLVILLAEDDPNDLALFRHAIKDTKYSANLQVVRDGEQVIKYLDGEGDFSNRAAYPFPDLLVLDLKMPRVNGLEVLKWLKNHPVSVALPAIMLSGSGLDPDVEEAYRLGVSTYFTKPTELGKLSELLKVLLDYWSRSQRPHIKG